MRNASIFDVIAAREALVAADVACELHLHDACGAQTMELRPLDNAPDDVLSQAYAVVEGVFAERGLAVEVLDAQGRNLRVR
jgi:hypothetical protein